MAKIINAPELAQIVKDAVEGDLIDDRDQYAEFLEGLADLLTKHFGGVRQTSACGPDYPGDPLGWTVGIHLNDQVPPDGGVWKDYDTDEVWRDGLQGELDEKGRFVPDEGSLQNLATSVPYGPISEELLDEIDRRVNTAMTGHSACLVDTEALAETLRDAQMDTPAGEALVRKALQKAISYGADRVEFFGR